MQERLRASRTDDAPTPIRAHPWPFVLVGGVLGGLGTALSLRFIGNNGWGVLAIALVYFCTGYPLRPLPRKLIAIAIMAAVAWLLHGGK